MDEQVAFVNHWLEVGGNDAGIFMFRDRRTRQTVGVAIVLLGAVYMSRDRLKLEDNQPGLRQFGLWTGWNLKNTDWQTSSAVRLLCAKPQYLHAVMQRLVRSPQLGSGILQVSVPLEDVRRFRCPGQRLVPVTRCAGEHAPEGLVWSELGHEREPGPRGTRPRHHPLQANLAN